VTGAPKRYAILLLLAGVVLGVGTPLYLAYAAPHLSIYLRNPVILAGQAVPYVVCAGLDRHHGRAAPRIGRCGAGAVATPAAASLAACLISD
jgi:hypothetical protein